jgi:putative methionine-R-sulfoxide reductase with GAF domain
MQTLERRCWLLIENERRPDDWVTAVQDAGHAAAPSSVDAGVLPHLVEKLRGVQSITDRALSELDSQALLEVLVERVRDALQADTAAVLLLDHPSGQLVATAASGLEEEVRQGVRIHIGRGFAGRIAAQGAPVVLDEVDHTKVVNPILLSKGIRSLMGAPLIANGAVIGVLHVGTLKPRKFTTDDVDLLQLAADRAAMAVLALQAQLDRAAASALQRSLLPSDLPSVPGLSMAARYVPGTGNVGGDWYDVFPLPSGELCAVIGDVAGSGLRAAAIMGRVKSALRAYALESSDPAEILGRLETKLAYFEPDAMVTLLCAIFSRSGDRVRIASAGHLPPILARPGQAAAPAEIASDVLIGVPEVIPRHVTSFDFPAGGMLCLYTDGLVERRGQPIDDGIRKLCAAVPTGDPEVACACVMAAMADGTRTDDVALLIICREPGQVQGLAGPGDFASRAGASA